MKKICSFLERVIQGLEKSGKIRAQRYLESHRFNTRSWE